MTGRRFLLYFAWSRPAECDVNLAILENRYPTLFEFRRALWPILDELRHKPNQMVYGFLDHVVLSDFELFRSLVKEKTGNEVAVVQRVLETGAESQLTRNMLQQYDTIIIVSLDHFRSGQHATDVEVQFIREFLAMPEKCVVICPHHDIGSVQTQPQQEIEYRHHGDGLIPPQQQIGGFARSLMAGLGYPIENRFGLNPARDSQGRPAELLIDRDADTSHILRGVNTFNLHPHLPHLFVPASLSESVKVLARQSISLAASSHPFVSSGNRHFNAFLEVTSDDIAGRLYVCDATLWSSAFGGTDSLRQFWINLAASCNPTRSKQLLMESQMFQFAPPAKVSDLSASLKTAWSEVVHGWFTSAAERLVEEHQQSQSDIRLFNLLDTPSGASGPSAEIQWNGFPRKYKLVVPNVQTRWELVEEPRNFDLTGRQAAYFKKLPDGTFVRANHILFRDQDEYCEWHSFRSPSGELRKVVFTCENPEYWQFIAENDPDLLLSLYQQLSDGPVSMADLFFNEDIFVPGLNGQAVNLNGKYNPHNKWNSTHGAIHLTHPANSLSAEVFLAADATILRDVGGNPVTGAGDLICCSAYGGPDRSSDPTIGAFVNGLVRQGLSVTINDPVGLYIHSLDPNPFELPAGISFDDCWKIVRGNKDEKQILRAEFSLPNGEPLSNVLVGGEPLNFGAQIAEFVSIVIYGKAFDAGNGAPNAMPCVGHCCVNPSLPSLQSILDIGEPCPTVPGPGNLEAAMTTAPKFEKLPSLENVKDAYTR